MMMTYVNNSPFSSEIKHETKNAFFFMNRSKNHSHALQFSGLTSFL